MDSKLKHNNLLKYFSLQEFEELLEINDLYVKAETIVNKLFKNVVDKDNKPYVGHLIRVSNSLKEPIEKVAGLLHDTLEDTCVTYNDLLDVGFTNEILDIVKLVTNENVNTENLSQKQKLALYYKKIDKIIASNNINAIRLKEADMSDNFNPARIDNLPSDVKEWLTKKYSSQIVKLRKVLNKWLKFN